MLDVKCCSDRIQPLQNLTSVLRSLYNNSVCGHQSRGWSAPSVDTGEQRQACSLHQGAPAQACRSSIRKRFNFYSPTLLWPLLAQSMISIKHSQIWKTHPSDIVRGRAKLFRQASTEKSTKSLATGQGGERDLRRGYSTFLPPKSDAFLSSAVQLKSFDLCIQNWENDWPETFPPALPSPISN